MCFFQNTSSFHDYQPYHTYINHEHFSLRALRWAAGICTFLSTTPRCGPSEMHIQSFTSPAHDHPVMPTSQRIASWLTRLHIVSLFSLPSFRSTGFLNPRLPLRNFPCSLWPSPQNCHWLRTSSPVNAPDVDSPPCGGWGGQRLTGGYKTLLALRWGQCWGEIHAPELAIRPWLDFTWSHVPAQPLSLPLLASPFSFS